MKLKINLRKNSLSRFGYEKIIDLTERQRRIALNKSVKEYGSLTVWKKLNLLYIYNKYKNRSLAKKVKEDRDYIALKLDKHIHY